MLFELPFRLFACDFPNGTPIYSCLHTVSLAANPSEGNGVEHLFRSKTLPSRGCRRKKASSEAPSLRLGVKIPLACGECR